MGQQIRITNTREEADVTMVNQAYDAVLQNGVGRLYVVCDDTHVFALLNITADIEMLPTDTSRNVVDINKAVESNIWLDSQPFNSTSTTWVQCSSKILWYS